MGYDMYMVRTPESERELYPAAAVAFHAACKARDALPQDTPEWKAAQEEVNRTYEVMHLSQTGYFRLNIWGMASYRDVMEETGMGYWAEEMNARQPWPEQSDYQVSEAGWEAYDYSDRDEESPTGRSWDADHPCPPEDLPELQRYYEDIEKIRAMHPGEIPGIPLVKFCSNDGWLVTPEECRSALVMFGRWVRAQPEMRDAEALQSVHQFQLSSDEVRKALLIERAMPLKVGHPPLSRDEEDDRHTNIDVMASDSFVQWLSYLERAIDHGGFRVY